MLILGQPNAPVFSELFRRNVRSVNHDAAKRMFEVGQKQIQFLTDVYNIQHSEQRLFVHTHLCCNLSCFVLLRYWSHSNTILDNRFLLTPLTLADKYCYMSENLLRDAPKRVESYKERDFDIKLKRQQGTILTSVRNLSKILKLIICSIFKSIRPLCILIVCNSSFKILTICRL